MYWIKHPTNGEYINLDQVTDVSVEYDTCTVPVPMERNTWQMGVRINFHLYNGKYRHWDLTKQQHSDLGMFNG